MYTFCLNYRTKGLHLFPSFWGKSCASQYSIFFFFFRLAHLLLNFLVKRCAPFGQNIKQKVYTLWSKKCTPFASIFYRKVYTFCPIRLSFTTCTPDLKWLAKWQEFMQSIEPQWKNCQYTYFYIFFLFFIYILLKSFSHEVQIVLFP